VKSSSQLEDVIEAKPFLPKSEEVSKADYTKMSFSPFSMLYHTNEGGREALEEELMAQYRLDKKIQEEAY